MTPRRAIFLLIAVVLLVGVVGRSLDRGSSLDLSLSELTARVESSPDDFEEILFRPNNQEIEATLTDGTKIEVNYPTSEAQIAFQERLESNGIPFDSKGTGGSLLGPLLFALLPLLIIVGLFVFLMRRAQGAASGIFDFGKSKAKRVTPDQPKVTFRDVAGADEAIEELREIKEFLENPKRFRALGARIPKGVLLTGPPGTGKTLLARAVAGEAGAPFFSIAGSDFVEMFVGVGASRVRSLFEQAKQVAPAIIFIDEIDAVGRHRGAGLGGGNDEREQTLNQLLVEMDGFELTDTVIVIAATNRPDVLDPALLRPGRFDRQIVVDRPDRTGRREILAVHSRGKPLAPEIDMDVLAAGTPGFTGADLANLINEAALLSARRGKSLIEMDDLEEGMIRIVAGPEKKARILTEEERSITAYHEMGHALVGHFLTHADPIHRISIVSRGQALGMTISLPTEDRFLQTKSALLDSMAMALGGRVAEELVFDEITTGAANDLERVTDTAKQMVKSFGMSRKLGPLVLGRRNGAPFLGRDLGAEPDYSDDVAREIDDAIRCMADDAYERARRILSEHLGELHTLSALLIEHEVIDGDQFERLLAGELPTGVFPGERAPQATASAGADGTRPVRTQARPARPLPGDGAEPTSAADPEEPNERRKAA